MEPDIILLHIISKVILQMLFIEIIFHLGAVFRHRSYFLRVRQILRHKLGYDGGSR